MAVLYQLMETSRFMMSFVLITERITASSSTEGGPKICRC